MLTHTHGYAHAHTEIPSLTHIHVHNYVHTYTHEFTIIYNAKAFFPVFRTASSCSKMISSGQLDLVFLNILIHILPTNIYKLTITYFSLDRFSPFIPNSIDELRRWEY